MWRRISRVRGWRENAFESGETVMSRSMTVERIPILARRTPASRPVGPAPEMRTGTYVSVGGDAGVAEVVVDAETDAPSGGIKREDAMKWKSGGGGMEKEKSDERKRSSWRTSLCVAESKEVKVQ